MPFSIIPNDITKLDVDAIVNPANTSLQMGGGVCGAIFSAAGADRLQVACDSLAPIKTGEAVVTQGFDLPAKYIIHTAGPVYRDGKHGEEALLRDCYINSLNLAVEHDCESIAFPLISSGIYGYPHNEALRIAEVAIQDFISEKDIDVFLLIYVEAASAESGDVLETADCESESIYNGNNQPSYQEPIPASHDENLPTVHELKILVTEEDMYGVDITAMSDFFDGYVQQLTGELNQNSIVVEVANLPIANLGIISDIVHHMDVVVSSDYSYLPDFEHLPKNIRNKLYKGIYKLGESRQVDGNLRPVILDENGVRVKDITLKEVPNDHGTVETTRNIVSQLQMRQLFAKLDSIQELQSYQIDRDRDRDIVTPFLNARDNILRAQKSESTEVRTDYIKKAVAELTTAINASYTDLDTAITHLQKLTRWPIFQRTNEIKKYIDFFTRDLQLVTKFVGVQTHLLDYLGESRSAVLELERYQHIIHGFFSKPLGAKKSSAAMLVHKHFPYTDANRNSWVHLAKEVRTKFQLRLDILENKNIILVSVEDYDNAEGK